VEEEVVVAAELQEGADLKEVISVVLEIEVLEYSREEKKEDFQEEDL
jgi:hypothetical protein